MSSGSARSSTRGASGSSCAMSTAYGRSPANATPRSAGISRKSWKASIRRPASPRSSGRRRLRAGKGRRAKSVAPSLRAKRSNPLMERRSLRVDCFAASLLANDSKRGRRATLLPPAAALAESHFLGQARSRDGVGRRDHRVVGGQAPFGAILLRRQIVLGAQVPFQRLELLSVFETDEMVLVDRFLGRNGGRQDFGLGGRANRKSRESRVDLADQGGQLVSRQGIVRHKSRDDFCGELDVTWIPH